MDSSVGSNEARGTKTPLAVFDYDGTCIDAQSGKLIAMWLARRGYLSVRSMARLAWWGARYKLHLPYRQAEARELIFRDLGRRDPGEVAAIVKRFHDEVLVSHIRPHALVEVARRKKEGCVAVLVSATFDQIAREAARWLDLDGYVATEMETDAYGRYTGRVSGEVIAGRHKVEVAVAWADKHLGVGSWELAYAYGDHHTDEELLSAATYPCAVSPGPTLKKIAHRNGWPIEDWDA